MTQTVQWLLLSGSTTMSFIYAATTPTVQVYFIQFVSAQVLAVANIVGIGLAAFVNSTISSAREFYHRWFLPIIVIDVMCFWIISLSGLEWPVVRFLGFAILTAVSTTLWMMVIKDAINGVLSGVSLTNWQAKSNAFELYGAFAGGLVAVFVPNMDVEFCVLLQCMSNMLVGITDWMGYRKLQED